MSNYQMQMPAQYTSIGDDEMVLLCGGETTAWQTFQDIGRVLNYVARIFSAGSSIVNNVVTIVNYFNKLEDLLPVIGEVVNEKDRHCCIAAVPVLTLSGDQ